MTFGFLVSFCPFLLSYLHQMASGHITHKSNCKASHLNETHIKRRYKQNQFARKYRKRVRYYPIENFAVYKRIFHNGLCCMAFEIELKAAFHATLSDLFQEIVTTPETTVLILHYNIGAWIARHIWKYNSFGNNNASWNFCLRMRIKRTYSCVFVCVLSFKTSVNELHKIACTEWECNGYNEC